MKCEAILRPKFYLRLSLARRPRTVPTLSAAEPAAREPDQLRSRIDAALDGYSRFDESCPDQLREAIRYALLGSRQATSAAAGAVGG